MLNNFSVTIVHHPTGLQFPVNKEMKNIYYIISFTDNQPTDTTSKNRWKLYYLNNYLQLTDIMTKMYTIGNSEKVVTMSIQENSNMIYFTITYYMDKQVARRLYEHFIQSGFEELDLSFRS